MKDELKKYSGTMWGIVCMVEVLAKSMDEEGIREIETSFSSAGQGVEIKVKSR